MKCFFFASYYIKVVSMDYKTAINVKQVIASTIMDEVNRYPKKLTYSAYASPHSVALERALKANVNGIGIGEKASGENYITVLTRDKLSVNVRDLSRHYGIKVDDVVVKNAGPITFLMPTNNHRPPFPGISVGHYNVSAGTLGCFVQDNNNRTYILSNNHVLADCNKGKYKDPILQPGALDGGLLKKDVIAELSYLVPLETSKPNLMDAAIAEIVPDLIPGYKVPLKNKISGTIYPANGMKVEKFGRTTRHTKGSITTRNLDIKVEFDGKVIDFQDQFEVKSSLNSRFCGGGDSGALIFEKDSLQAVGLLFAGTGDGTTFATPIQEVLDAFCVKIV